MQRYAEFSPRECHAQFKCDSFVDRPPVIGVQKSAANEAAIANPATKQTMGLLGIGDFRLFEPKPNVEGPRPEIPAFMSLLGEEKPHNYLAEGRVHYGLCDYAKRRPWESLTTVERVQFCIISTESFLADTAENNPFDWALIMGSKSLDPATATPTELFNFAKAEMVVIEARQRRREPDRRTLLQSMIGFLFPQLHRQAIRHDERRHSALSTLAHVSMNRDMLEQLKAILQTIQPDGAVATPFPPLT